MEFMGLPRLFQHGGEVAPLPPELWTFVFAVTNDDRVTNEVEVPHRGNGVLFFLRHLRAL